MNKKVCIVTIQFPSPREVFACNNLTVLSEKGYIVDVFTLRGKHKSHNKMISDRKLNDINIFTGSLVSFVFGIILSVRYLKKALWLLTQIIKNVNLSNQVIVTLYIIPRVFVIFNSIKNNKPDVVHSYWSHYSGLVLLLVHRFLPKIKTSCGAIAYDVRMNYFLSPFIYNSCNTIFSISEANTKIIASRTDEPAKIITVYHGLMPSVLFHNIKAKISMRFVTAGAFIIDKRMVHVLKVFGEIQKHYSESSLTLIGDGPEKDNLIKFVKKENLRNIVFLGHIPHEQVINEFNQATFFLFLSAIENIPNVVKEAISCKCYCIVSKTHGIEELISDGVSGLVVDVDKPEQAALKTLQILEKKQEYITDSIDRAYEHLTSNFNESANMDIYLSNWQK